MPASPKPPKAPGSPGSPGKATPSAAGVRASRANFRVLVDKVEVGVLSVSSPHLLDPSRVESRRPGGEGHDGLRSPPTVTLRRAVDGSRVFFNWARLAQGERPVRRTVTLLILDSPDGDPLYRWELRGAHPVRWSGPALHAMDGELAMEELELAYETVAWP